MEHCFTQARWLLRVTAFFMSEGALSCASGQAGKIAELEARINALEAARQASPPSTVEPAQSQRLGKFIPTESGWGMSGGGASAYEVLLDNAVQHDGSPTMRLSPIKNGSERYGTWMRHIDAAPYRGKRIRVEGYTKTEGVAHRADFWARVQGQTSPPDGVGLGGEVKTLPASSSWEKQEIVLDVAEAGAYIQYGVGIAGAGMLWLDTPRIEVVSSRAPVHGAPVSAGYPGEQTVNQWLKTGVGAPDFSIASDGGDVKIQRNQSDSKRFVALVHEVPADAFVGRKIKASFEVKALGLESDAACIVKVQAERPLVYSGFLAADLKPIASTTKGFIRCDTSVDVPAGATWILYGVTYRGAGTVWVRGGTLQ